MSKKYGNDWAWCFLEDGWETTRPIEVWHTLGAGQEEVMAHATDKYNAMRIVDALILENNTRGNSEKRLTKKETIFLEFVSSNCPEPWSTMASNAILWQDKETFNVLKAKFAEFY